MTDDDATNDQAIGETVRRDDAARDDRQTTTPKGDDGTTLTGESENPGDASRRDLVEPSGQ